VRDDYYHDDPVESSYGKNFFKRILVAASLILGSIYLFQTTFAANISLNSGQQTQFGQGLLQAVACSGSSSLTLSSGTSFVNGAGATGAHYLSSVTVSGIPNSCFGTDFVITAYDNASNTPLTIFNSTSTEAVVYNNNGTFTRGIGSIGSTVSSGSGTFTVTFDSPVALASSVYKLGIQSVAHQPFFKSIGLGDHSCLVLDSGGVKCWGSGGALGNNTVSNSSVPVSVSDLSSGVVAIANGTYHSCVVLDSGGVKCWGFNANGQLGDGTTTNRLTPVSVSGLSSGVRAISAGERHTCALLNSGEVKCWGLNSFGQIGDNSTTTQVSATTVNGLSSGVASISLGNFSSCAVLTNGSAKCWGYNSSGQLGNGSTTNSSVPVNVSGLSSGVRLIAPGSSHTCAILDSGGVRCWGDGTNGALGNGGGSSTTPVSVSGLSSGIMEIDSGSNHSCAILSSGAVKCWGANGSGNLGDGTTTNRSTPTSVIGLNSNASSIAAGVNYSCVIYRDSEVKCWGDNTRGKLGDGTTTQRLTPVTVLGLS